VLDDDAAGEGPEGTRRDVEDDGAEPDGHGWATPLRVASARARCERIR
jgi:hypothetical protein